MQAKIILLLLLFRLFRQNSFESFSQTSKTPRHKMLQAYMPRRRFSQVIHTHRYN